MRQSQAWYYKSELGGVYKHASDNDLILAAVISMCVQYCRGFNKGNLTFIHLRKAGGRSVNVSNQQKK